MRRAYQFYVGAAGSEAKAGEVLGQAAYDVDDFKDTRLGGWWVGYEHAPVWGAAASLVNYTSYWLTRLATATGLFSCSLA